MPQLGPQLPKRHLGSQRLPGDLSQREPVEDQTDRQVLRQGPGRGRVGRPLRVRLHLPEDPRPPAQRQQCLGDERSRSSSETPSSRSDSSIDPVGESPSRSIRRSSAGKPPQPRGRPAWSPGRGPRSSRKKPASRPGRTQPANPWSRNAAQKRMRSSWTSKSASLPVASRSRLAMPSRMREDLDGPAHPVHPLMADAPQQVQGERLPGPLRPPLDPFGTEPGEERTHRPAHMLPRQGPGGDVVPQDPTSGLLDEASPRIRRGPRPGSGPARRSRRRASEAPGRFRAGAGARSWPAGGGTASP